jgi:hypothetical protein
MRACLLHSGVERCVWHIRAEATAIVGAAKMQRVLKAALLIAQCTSLPLGTCM